MKNTTYLITVILLITMDSGKGYGGETAQVKSTHLELHSRMNGAGGSSQYVNQRAMLITLQHYSEQKYGDWFIFFDSLGKLSGQGDYAKSGEIYYHIEPRFSIPRAFGSAAPDAHSLIKDYYFVLRYNDADVSYINRALLAGFSVDLNHSRDWIHSVTLYWRQEDNNRPAPHITSTWNRDFSINNTKFSFNGSIDQYQNDTDWVTNSQVQFLGSPSFFTDDIWIGSEQQFTNNFYGAGSGFTWMPSVFIKVIF